MKNSGKNISLTSFDDIFSTEESRQRKNERIERLPLTDLVPFKDHPFRVVDDDRIGGAKVDSQIMGKSGEYAKHAAFTPYNLSKPVQSSAFAGKLVRTKVLFRYFNKPDYRSPCSLKL